MLRTLTLSIALAAACIVGGTAVAQTDGGESASSAKPNAQLASYSRSYSSGCTSCGSGDYSGGYSAAGYANAGGPQAMAYGQQWGGAASDRDCSRFYHYPYVFYPQNFKGNDYFKSSDSMYYRYPPEMQIPVYNKGWHNYYPSPRRYHWGHQFILDVF